MNIPTVGASQVEQTRALVVSSASSPAPATAHVDARSSAAVTLWISPPGLFFSILHRISQQFPTELKTALSTAVGRVLPKALGVVAPHRKPIATSLDMTYVGTKKRSEGRLTRVPETLEGLIAAVRQVAQRSDAEFARLAPEVAGTFADVAAEKSGIGAETMAQLASQLNQAARLESSETKDGVNVHSEPGPLEPVSPIADASRDHVGYSAEDPEM